MLIKQRNPFQATLYWACDDVKHGRCDWLEITALDTTHIKADGPVAINMPVRGWRSVNDPSVVSDSTSQAFVFPRQSGTVQGRYAQNRFELITSGVGTLTLYLSPEMVNFGHPLQVVINGQQVYKGPVAYDRAFMVGQYIKEMDHQALWVNRLSFPVK